MKRRAPGPPADEARLVQRTRVGLGEVFAVVQAQPRDRRGDAVHVLGDVAIEPPGHAFLVVGEGSHAERAVGIACTDRAHDGAGVGAHLVDDLTHALGDVEEQQNIDALERGGSCARRTRISNSPLSAAGT